ncbi:3D domain-containing protein [Piscibacillus sp. B03]|uniref:3D domain-containing protein n=1 Tax=Piscibacillus sp. B03 TaxID=3457430 RepID=UPI003FCC7E00
MSKRLVSVIAFLLTFGALMMLSTPLSATQMHSSTLDNQTGAQEHHVKFFSEFEHKLAEKGKIKLIEPEPETQQAQKSESQQDNQDVQQVSQESEGGKQMYVKATAYTAYCEGCSGTTYTGIDLRANPDMKVIAVDPNVIPLGSRVWVEGYGTAIAGDIGGAIKGNRIDIFMASEADANRFGVQQVRIRILD